MSKPAPMDQFKKWYAEMQAGVLGQVPGLGRFSYWLHELVFKLIGWLVPELDRIHNNAVNLSTCSLKGEVSSRIVLLKSTEKNGFQFYTNYTSLKGQHLAANPQAQLNFYWKFPLRQVRVWGSVTRLSQQESQAYWSSRPKESQISALASHQSHPIESYEALEKQVEELRREYKNKKIPCPDYWGGYHLEPTRFEFWQAKANRLHERQVFEKTDTGWRTYYLAP